MHPEMLYHLRANVQDLEWLLLIAVVVAIGARRLRLPYTVGLTIAGGALALLHARLNIQLTGPLIFDVLLPPLLFDAAFHLHWRDLRRDLPLVLVLAVFGVLLSAAVTTGGMHLFAHWDWPAAALFGALISATDPVSVIATFRDAGLTGRLRLLVEAESLFNDATAAVLFTTLLAALTASSVGPAHSMGAVAWTFVLSSAGGLLMGAMVGGAALLLLGRTDDHLVETALTTAAAYGAFLLAERLHVSGVLATLAAGLLLGNVGPLGAFTAKGHEAVEGVWEFLTFVVNSLVFLLLGVRVAQGTFAGAGAAIACAILLVLAGRALGVGLCCLPFARTARRVTLRQQGVLVWGGLRGALAMALALGLPDTLPARGAIQTATFAVVAFSVVVQGLTVAPLLRRTGQMR